MSNNLDNRKQPLGSGDVPTSSVSTGDDGVSGSGNQEVVLRRVEQLEGLVRSLQGDKDRGVKKALDEVSNLRDQLAQYEALRSKGLDPDAALDQMEIQQLLAERRAGRSPAGVPGGTGGGTPRTPATVDHTDLLISLGLDPNGAEVLSVIRSTTDPVMQEATFRAMSALKGNTPKPAPNPAQQVPVGGGTSVSERTIEDVEADLARIKNKPGYMGSKEYRDLVAEHRGFLSRL